MNSIIMEIRAGAGGEEAGLFAKDLFLMYTKYAQSQHWPFNVFNLAPSELGGLKQVAFEIRGEQVFSRLKYEGGVHRVQRVPRTEKSNRLHTSTVSVAVLKIPQATEIKINPKDLKMDFFRSSGPGGQNVNKRQTAIRITHLPSGLVVSSQISRNLEKNKKAALKLLEAKLFNQQQEALQTEVSQERRAQIGSSQRAEKIRTYNFPQDRLTDHRLKKSWHNLEKILSGNLGPIIKKLGQLLS